MLTLPKQGSDTQHSVVIVNDDYADIEVVDYAETESTQSSTAKAKDFFKIPQNNGGNDLFQRIHILVHR